MEQPRPHYARRVVDFGDLEVTTLDRQHPVLLRLLREHVWEERSTKTGSLKERWWQFAHKARELYAALDRIDRFIVTSQYSNSYGFCFLPTGGVVNSKIVAFSLDSCAAFCGIQSRVHEVWARFFSATLKDDLQYTPTDCLITFPFPLNWTADPTLEAAGQIYYNFRAALMIRNNQGLTATYNRFHDPGETDPDILELRRLHAKMDRAVLDAYGWADIPTDCVFRLDYEEPEDEEAEDTGKKRKKKKPWRLRWPEAVHDEVLARLLALNQQRAEEERKMSAPDKKPKATPKKAAAPKPARGAKPPAGPSLFGTRGDS